jgi:hypothetical protein
LCSTVLAQIVKGLQFRSLLQSIPQPTLDTDARTWTWLTPGDERRWRQGLNTTARLQGRGRVAAGAHAVGCGSRRARHLHGGEVSRALTRNQSGGGNLSGRE